MILVGIVGESVIVTARHTNFVNELHLKIRKSLLPHIARNIMHDY